MWPELRTKGITPHDLPACFTPAEQCCEQCCWQAGLLQPHGILSHWLSTLVIAGLPAKGEAFGQPEGAVLTLPFCHDDHQQQNEQDDDDSDGKEIEQRGAFGTQGFTCRCE